MRGEIRELRETLTVTHLLPDTDELVALHGEGVEPDVGGVDPDICELK